MSDSIPEFTVFSQFYSQEDSSSRERLKRVQESFISKFGANPEFISRSPGRVNLIGEHIDYEGYAVFPMAIRQDTVVAIKASGVQLHVANMKDEVYSSEIFEADPDQDVNIASHKWTNYFLAAYKGVHEFLKTKQILCDRTTGLQILVDGEVPTGSGLSSSSSLVCSCAIAILAALGHLHMASKAEIAEFTCSCERFSGTESGGMDQAISIMAKVGLAKIIEFNPVRGTDVKLPENGIFIVANSLTVSNKAETASERYNLRVVECRLASMVLGKLLGFSYDELQHITTLKQVQDIHDSRNTSGSKLTLFTVEKLLKEDPYSLKEVEEVLQFAVEPLFSNSPNGLRVLKSASGHAFHLRNRALHVFSEASRVLEVKSICENMTLSDDDKMKMIGKLMNDSHASCRDLYDCSCSELDELVSVCTTNGALGSRLTGAGWGGCVVSLIREDQQVSFIQNIKNTFYLQRIEAQLVKVEDLDLCIFASKPSAGAVIFDLINT